MSTRVAERLITAEEFAQMPESRGAELVRGRIVWPGVSEEPVNNWQHARLLMRLCLLFGSYAQRQRVGEFFAGDPGMIVKRGPDTARGPDLAFVAADRTGAVPQTGFSDVVADLVIEILSPSDTMVNVHAKVREYLKAGVRVVWIADSEGENVLEFRSRAAVRMFEGDDVLEAQDVLPGFRWPVRDLFDFAKSPLYPE